MPTATVRLASPPTEGVHDPTLNAALGQLRDRFGPSVAGCPDGTPPVATIPSGSLALDAAIGVGGVPRGRITEVYGPDGAGKTTLALSVIAQAQQAGGTCCFIDTEHALDLAWAATVGVDVERLILCRPADGEQALEVADVLVGSEALDVLVLDSIAALVPRAELDGEMGERHPGVQATCSARPCASSAAGSPGPGWRWWSPTSSASGPAPRAPRSTPRAAGRSATTPRFGWSCAPSASSATADRSLAAGSGSR
jgi:recA bacterial DNA recombination protein